MDLDGNWGSVICVNVLGRHATGGCVTPRNGCERDYSVMGDITIFGHNSLNLKFEQCVQKFLNRLLKVTVEFQCPNFAKKISLLLM